MSWRRHLVFACLAIFLLSTAAAEAASGSRPGADAWCGTDQEPRSVAIAKHRYHQKRLSREFAAQVKSGRLGTILKTDVRKEGNVLAVLDSGQIVRDENRSDVSDQGLDYKFKKKQGGYTVVSTGGGLSGSLGDKLDLLDDDTVEIDLPFKIKFFGKKWGSIFVNSDGNITFGEGDVDIMERDITRVLEGAPRIAPFFRDLNPETATGDGGVYVDIAKKSVKVTWVRVPEFDSTGANDTLNTFEATISKKGRVTFRFGELQSIYAIVGVAPGGGSAVDLLDYTEEIPTPVLSGAIAEIFDESSTADVLALAKAVMAKLQDRYLELVVFTDFSLVLGQATTIAFHQPIKNEIQGIGRGTFDDSRFYGSDGALEGLVMMGEIQKYAGDLESPSFINGLYSATDILMHEIGHKWGVRVRFQKDGAPSTDLLGRAEAHWGFCTNSKNSYLEGNGIVDNGDGTYTTTVASAQYSDLDRYLMGLGPAADVNDLFYVDQCDSDRAPAGNITLAGPRVDVSIDDIIAAEGPRDPEFGDAPTKFNVAFVLLTKGGAEPSPGSIDRVNELRKLAAARFKQAGGKLNTSIKLK